MKNNELMELAKLCMAYDPYTDYIDSYDQQVFVERRNEEVKTRLQEMLKTFGLEMDALFPLGKGKDDLVKWLGKKGVTVEKRVWTEDEIRVLVQTNDKVLYGALLKLYGEQTSDEQDDGATKYHNKRGFNGTDSRFLSSVAEFLKKRGFLTEKQKYCVRRKLVKYNKQLTRLANAG